MFHVGDQMPNPERNKDLNVSPVKNHTRNISESEVNRFKLGLADHLS